MNWPAPSLCPPAACDDIRSLQSERKRHAVEQARRAPFFKGKLDRVNLDRLDEPEEWSKITILDKDMLRSMSDADLRQLTDLLKQWIDIAAIEEKRREESRKGKGGKLP